MMSPTEKLLLLIGLASMACLLASGPLLFALLLKLLFTKKQRMPWDDK